MKKVIAVLLVLILCISLCACGQTQSASATVTLSDGTTKTVTAEDVRSNSFKYEEAEITITGKVEKIAQDAFGWTYVIIEGGWKVVVEEEAILDNDVEVGSVIRIEGNIYEADKDPVVIKYTISEDRHDPVGIITKLS